MTASITVFTVGHSTHTDEHFVSLLRQHRVSAVADVRSTPYSRLNPQFNRETFKESLLRATIKYVFLGKELGARSDDPSCYEGRTVKYDRIARTELFRAGLTRVLEGAQKFTLALMCAEKEPLDCHRTILVARYLEPLGVNVLHVHADGTLERHADALSRLARTLNLQQHTLFSSRDEVDLEAYRRQEERIAYQRPVMQETVDGVGGSS